MEGSGSPDNSAVPEAAAAATLKPALPTSSEQTPATAPTVPTPPEGIDALGAAEPTGTDAGSGEPVDTEGGASDAGDGTKVEPVTSPAEPESKPAQTLSPEQQERTKNALEMIRIAQNRGDVFTSAESRSSARIAIESGGQDTKAVLAALRVLGYYAKDAPSTLANVRAVNEVISRDFEITVDGNVYKLSDLESERVDPKTDPARKAEIEKIIDEGLTVELTPREAVDQAVGKQIAALEAKKNRSEKEEAILVRLRFAREASGPAGMAFKIGALNELKASGVEGLDSVINQGAGLEPQAYEAIMKHFELLGHIREEIARILGAISKGQIRSLQEAKILEGSGVDRLFFGRELNEKELQSLMLSVFDENQAREIWKKHGKNAAMMILIFIAMGVVPSAKKMLLPTD